MKKERFVVESVVNNIHPLVPPLHNIFIYNFASCKCFYPKQTLVEGTYFISVCSQGFKPMTLMLLALYCSSLSH